MDYVTIFDSVPWEEVGYSVLQTFSLYWLILLGLKATGRRLFAENKPEDLVILVLVAEACDLGLSHEDAGYWGTFFSVITIFAMGALIERIPPLRRFLDGKPKNLLKNGALDKQTMRKNFIDEADLEEVARNYGLRTYHDFEAMFLETGGNITGVVKPSKLLAHNIQAKD